MTGEKLIEKTLAEFHRTRLRVENLFLNLSDDQLNKKSSSNSWSAAECFQHLIFTNASYLRSFNNLDRNEVRESDRSLEYKHSFWGKFILFFINPENKLRSKTTRDFNPIYRQVESQVVENYLILHTQLASAISNMKNLNLRTTKIPSPINKKINYNLGDAIKIIEVHDKRHVQQAERAITKG